MRRIYKDINGELVVTSDPIQQALKVGIYWCVDNVIVGDAVTVAEAEPYGEALQHGGHYDYWLQLRPSTSAEKKLKSHAYDYYPRGRLVFFPERKIVRLYIDSCLDNNSLNETLEFFEHGDFQVEIEADDHYRCAGCNRHYME